jgi:Na+/melibiose symporter-like transporter
VLEQLLFGFGQTAYGAKIQALMLVLLFYNQVLGAPAAWISLAVAITLFLNAAWDPIIGHVSDILQTRWGRRHPLLYICAIPFGLTFAMIWAPPAGLSPLGLVVYLFVVLSGLRFFASFYELASSALVPELAPNYDRRTVLVSYRFLFQTLGRAAAAFVSLGFFLRTTATHPAGQLNPAGYPPMGVALGLLSGIAVLICALATHREIPHLHRPLRQRPNLGRTLRDMGATLANWNFGVAVVAGFTSAVANGLTSGLNIYLSTYFWELPATSIFQLVMVELITAPIAAVVAPVLGRRMGKKRACMLLFFISVATNNAPVLLRLLHLFPGNHSPWLMPLLLADRAISPIFGTGGFILVTSMIADIVEDSQAKTGRRSEGLLLSANSLLNQAATAGAAILPGLLLVLVGFPLAAKPGHVDPQILRHLAWLFLPLSAGSSVVSISIWGFYRIDRATHERNLAAAERKPPDWHPGPPTAGKLTGLDSPAAAPDSAALNGPL